MADIRLFRTSPDGVRELDCQSIAVEKSLQTLIETHLEDLLGVRFLRSEYATGKRHGGRIDTLGIDENGCPVIIEYKRAVNQNVVNQGLFYLDWLMDHKGDFQVLVMDRLGADIAQNIEWASPRLLCIAGDFTKYDEHAVQQINRNIELIRYRRYGDELLLLELVNAASGPPEEHSSPRVVSETPRREDPTFTDLLGKCPSDLSDRFEALKAFTLALGDDVQVKTLKFYVAFKRIRNFVCAEVHPQIGTLVIWLKIDPDQVELEPGFTRDMREVGHYGTGDLEITIRTNQDFEKAQPLILQSYEGV